MITLQLTRKEAVKLEMFLLMTTKFRQGELETHKKLAAQVDENGNPAFPESKDNIEFWSEQCEVMDAIQKRVYEAMTTPQGKAD